MWNPKTVKNINYSSENAKVCVSESLDEIKMQQNSNKCPGYLSYKEFIGHEKGK